jgi:hypothetical protein
MTINGYNDPVGELATANADKALLIKKNGNYKKGIAICKEAGCTRIVEGHCYGWDDPLYMWEHYGECPYFSDDFDLVKKIDSICEKYEKYMNLRSELIGKKTETNY